MKPFISASRCKIPSLGDGVMASPLKSSYNIGEFVTLSCPTGRELRGDARVTCDPSLNFSPDPTTVSCISGKCSLVTTRGCPAMAQVYLLVMYMQSVILPVCVPQCVDQKEPHLPLFNAKCGRSLLEENAFAECLTSARTSRPTSRL